MPKWHTEDVAHCSTCNSTRVYKRRGFWSGWRCRKCRSVAYPIWRTLLFTTDKPPQWWVCKGDKKAKAGFEDILYVLIVAPFRLFFALFWPAVIVLVVLGIIFGWGR